MNSQGAAPERTALSPEAAFDALASKTRLRILETLHETNDQLSFTALREAVGIRHGAQFNYHLEQLLGHFVEKTDAGYALGEPGRHAVEIVHSGALTKRPIPRNQERAVE
jgi:hypothetical protein